MKDFTAAAATAENVAKGQLSSDTGDSVNLLYRAQMWLLCRRNR